MANPYHFGDWQFDPNSHVLRSDHDSQTLRFKIGRLLTLLIDNRERVVSQAEIRETLWPNEHVVDHALRQTVSELRKLLGDAPRKPTYIKTIPGQGYRWIYQTPASEDPAPPPATHDPLPDQDPPAAAAPAPSRKQGWPAVVLAVLLLAFLVFRQATVQTLEVGPLESLRGIDSSNMVSSNGVDHFALIHAGDVAFHDLATQNRFRFLTPEQTMVAATYQADFDRYLLADGRQLTVVTAEGHVRQKKASRIVRFHQDGSQNLVTVKTEKGRFALHHLEPKTLEPRLPALTEQDAPIWAALIGDTLYFTTTRATSIQRVRNGYQESWLDLTALRPYPQTEQTGLYAHGDTLILGIQGPHSQVDSLLQIHLINTVDGTLRRNAWVFADQLLAGKRGPAFYTFQTQKIEDQFLHRLKENRLSSD